MHGKSQILLISFIAAFADHTSLGGDLRLTGENLSWNPKLETSPEFVIGIQNSTGTTDWLIAWDLNLQVVPEAGSTGNISFYRLFRQASYLLAGRSIGIDEIIVGPSAENTVFFDGDALHSGVPVPASGASLLTLGFHALTGTRGTFDIVAWPELVQPPGFPSRWASTDAVQRDFANLPFDGGPVVLGSVQIVPEPSTFCIAMIGIAAIAFGRHHLLKSRHSCA